jgi:hypothetical protein
MNVGKATKAESGGGVTSQSPRGATSAEQRLGEAQRQTVGAGGGGNKQPPKVGQVVDP